MVNSLPPILQVGDVLISSDLLTEQFCCDLEVCRGACCVEGDAGAPVTLDEVMQIENSVNAVWNDLSASAQAVIDRQGVAYTDEEGDLVTSIVGGKDCVFVAKASPPAPLRGERGVYTSGVDGFSNDEGDVITMCALEMAYHAGKCAFCKPISCALYPIREKTFSDGTVALNYHRWDICRCGREKGKALGLPVYRFLEGPLVRRFGQAWYDELCTMATELKQQGYL